MIDTKITTTHDGMTTLMISFSKHLLRDAVIKAMSDAIEQAVRHFLYNSPHFKQIIDDMLKDVKAGFDK